MSLKVKYNRLIGFTLVEILISLVIVGMLLAAVAVVLNASAINYRENEEVFRSINEARQALTRMTSQIRTAGWDVNGVCNAVDPYAPNNQCNLNTNTGENITYEFRDSSYAEYPNTLLLITNSNGNKYVLCDNVTACQFIKTLAGDGFNAKSVRISLIISDGDMEQKLSAAAVVRRVLEY
jgi:prepilin-type N-terminal cleavage/methylation domain-containing protein